MAHGRYCSRAVRRREGGTSRRHFAPTRLCPSSEPSGTHMSAYWPDSGLPEMRGQRRRESHIAIDESRNGSTGSAKVAQ